jgi:hypothetical protein
MACATLNFKRILINKHRTMEKNEIKKALYRQKPEARIRFIRKNVAYYYADLDEQRIEFEIPVNDMGDADFLPTMEAKLLIRWVQA